MERQPTPVVIFACDRPDYLQRTLDAVLANDDEGGRRIVVSQHGFDERVSAVVRRYGARLEHLTFSGAIRDGSQPEDGWPHGRDHFDRFEVYYRIAQHFGWAFGKLFDTGNLDEVIVLEDDIEIAPDFFSYFRGTIPLMRRDPTIWTVSAWNDNGAASMVGDREQLHRTDFFPGLGWFLTRSLWEEVRDVWPLATWDDWLRRPAYRKGRSVIYPEVSRSYHFGITGSSKGEANDRLDRNLLNDVPIDFEAQDLDYLIKARYDAELASALDAARLIAVDDPALPPEGDLKIIYHGERGFDELAVRFDIWPGFRDAGAPRCSYDGVVSFMQNKRRIFLVPLSRMTGGDVLKTIAGERDRATSREDG